tara:strand:+ start:682 stop:1284 length:603 start_codon:yes stop_codon:yes gene_type:complete
MATAYPSALDTSGNQLRTDISSTDDLDASGKEHDVMHVNVHGAAIALETKLGTGSSTPSSGAVLMGDGSGSSAWDTTPTIGGNTTVSGTLTASVAVGQAVDLERKTDNYTLVLADAGKVIEMNKGSGVNLTIPPNSSVAFPVGTQIAVVQLGAGQVTIVEGSGVTTRSDGDKAKISGQYSSCVLIKHETDEWYILGNLAS